MATIFLEYKQQYEGFSYFATRVPPWVNVSYICQYWRSVALNCANLWTHLFFVSSQWMDELLRRSKMAPLIIRIDFYCPKSGPGNTFHSLEKALDHMEHIQDLWIDCHSKDIFYMIHTRLTAPAPLLQSLHLSAFEGGQKQFIICKDTLPGASLQSLHLRPCHMDWSP